MKNLIIDKVMSSTYIREFSERCKLSTDDMWCLYYDTGCEFLDDLKIRMKKKRFFDLIFKPIIDEFGQLSPRDVFNTILASPHFWGWWSSYFWELCEDLTITNTDMLRDKIKFEVEIIPIFILENIFSYDKETTNNPGRDGKKSIKKQKV